MTRLTGVLGLIAGLAALHCQPDSLEAQELRRLPYPFGQLITISSDVDDQAPWHGRAIHRFLNEQLGMPISDSLWVSSAAGMRSSSALFRSVTELNNEPSAVGRQSVFGLLAREWHRGNIDHFHTWTDDALPQFRSLAPEPLSFSSEGTIDVSVGPAPWIAVFEAAGNPNGRGYQQLRLLFDRTPPDDLQVELRFSDDTRQVFPPSLTRTFRTEPVKAPALPATLTLFLNQAWPLGAGIAGSAPLPALRSVRITSDSCKGSCEVRYVGIERDNFSRWSVKQQLPIVELLNMRPALVTSHGGNTYHPSFEGSGPTLKFDMDFGPGSEFLRQNPKGLAGTQGAHAGYADILSKLNVKTVTSIYNGSATEIVEPVQAPSVPEPIYGNFYSASKAHVDLGSTAEALDALTKRLAAVDPVLAKTDFSDLLCTTDLYCRQGSQGATVGALVHISRLLADHGRKVEHHWYTHLGTARWSPTFTASSEQPFPAGAMKQLRLLAMDHYDPSGHLPLTRRTWVPASGVWSMYRIMREQLRDRISVGPASKVEIASYFDPVLKRRMPESGSGARDLHGITVYVPNAATATAALDGRPISLFTRNPVDETGRQSITFVDDMTPTMILSRLEPTEYGQVSTSGASHRWIPASGRAAEGAPSDYLSLTAEAPSATVLLTPRDLKLWNSTHLAFGYRIRREDGRQPQGALHLVLHMATGARIVVKEGTDATVPEDGDVGKFIAHAPRDTWTTAVLAQHDFKWKAGAAERPILPLAIGKVERVEIGLRGAAPGDLLEIGDMKALRPSSNGIAPDELLLVGGQVVDQRGAPLPRAAIRIVNQAGSVTNTAADSWGNYFVRLAKRGDVLSITAQDEIGTCPPRRGNRVEIWKNEAELDIFMADCGRETKAGN